MSKAELETIALDCLERLDAEAKAGRRSQDEKIQSIENRVNDYERQLMRLSGLVRTVSGPLPTFGVEVVTLMLPARPFPSSCRSSGVLGWRRPDRRHR